MIGRVAGGLGFVPLICMGMVMLISLADANKINVEFALAIPAENVRLTPVCRCYSFHVMVNPQVNDVQ